jgi:hypothetical protein
LQGIDDKKHPTEARRAYNRISNRRQIRGREGSNGQTSFGGRGGFGICRNYVASVGAQQLGEVHLPGMWDDAIRSNHAANEYAAKNYPDATNPAVLPLLDFRIRLSAAREGWRREEGRRVGRQHQQGPCGPARDRYRTCRHSGALCARPLGGCRCATVSIRRLNPLHTLRAR